MSRPSPEEMLSVLKIILSPEVNLQPQPWGPTANLPQKEEIVQQWQGDALDDDERGRLRRLSDRFPPPSQGDSGVGQVAGRLSGVVLGNGNIKRKRKAINETPSDQEDDDEEEEEVEVSREDTRSFDGPRRARSRFPTDQPPKVPKSNHPTTPMNPKRKVLPTKTSNTPTTPKRKVPPTKTPTTPTSRARQPSRPATPSTGMKLRPMVVVQNGIETWGTIRKLHTLQLHKTIAGHLESNTGGDPTLFLDDVGSLLLFQSKAPAVQSTQEGFAAILLYHNQMEHRSILDRVRTLFMWLFFGDFAAAEYGEHCRITKPKARAIVDALDSRLMSRNEMAEKQREEIETTIMEQIPDFHIKGKKLAHLCKRFGTGSLFWLAEHLTPHFVKNRITLDGGPYYEAMDKLEALGLKEKAESSGANRLGDRTRAVLGEVFRVGVEDNGEGSG